MSRVQDPDREQFLKDIETRYGGSVEQSTFSLFYADSDHNLREYGVSVFRVNGRLYYEDYKRDNMLFGIRLPDGKKGKEYVKFSSSFSPSDIIGTRKVRKSDAKACASGYRSLEKVRTAGLFGRIFFDIVTELRLSDGRVLYFQFMDRTVEKDILKA